MKVHRLYGGFSLVVLAASLHVGCNQVSHADYRVEVDTIYESNEQLFLQARSVVIPGEPSGSAMITMSEYGYGTHAYGNLYMLRMENDAQTWSSPELINTLQLTNVNDSLSRSFGDVTPDWHKLTGTVLATGKSFFMYTVDTGYTQGNKRIDIEGMQEVSYASYHPESQSWSGINVLDLPASLRNGDLFQGVNAGCTQRVDLPNGDVLLPIRYTKENKYITTVIRCSFDGKKLSYVAHGDTFTVPEGRGLYEPSITSYKGRYYLTMRGDDSAYVASSADGLRFGPMEAWRFDTGDWLGSYNTQQHWVSTVHGLFLVYTRKGAGNDHIFRHRAPLFIAEVDPDALHVIKQTEKVLMPIPDDGGDLGNFGITHVSEEETWVTAPVTPKALNDPDRETRILIAKIHWK